MTTRLVLIRHAEAQATLDDVVPGPRGDSGLSSQGREQARLLGDRLKGARWSPDLFLSSVLPRAIQTAQAISSAWSNAEPLQDCASCELHPGNEADGISWDEYRWRWGVVPDLTPDQVFAPGGESLRGFERRVARAIDSVLHNHRGKTIVAVTHGGFIAAACLQFLGHRISTPRPFSLMPKYTSITIWTAGGEQEGNWILERFNEAAHLGIT
jgi:2,3-bisphosphoglycerate-dependent phosphoglycerate mutase